MSQPLDADSAAGPVPAAERVGTSGSPAPADSLSRVLADLDDVERLPLEQRAAAFERMHDAIADALGRTVDRAAPAGSSPAAGGGTR